MTGRREHYEEATEQPREGEGLPPYIRTAADRERWRNSEKVARDLFGDNPAAVWEGARLIFDDRVSYPD